MFNKEQVIGSSPLDFEPTQDRKAYLIKKTNHLKKTGEYFTDTTQVQHDNIIITIQHQWFPVYEADNITSYAVISTDITEQVQLETDKRNSEKALEKALIQQKIAEEKNRLKSDFLANMSHELRTPLNAIMGYAQLLKVKDTLTEKQHHYLNEIYQGSEHLLNLINGLLDLSKIEAGQMKFEPIDQQLNEIMNQIIQTVTPITNTSNQTILLSLDKKTPIIFTDPTKFHQIMLNLLSNAIKFSPEQSTISISTKTNNDNLIFSIKDEGPGIPEELKSQLFDRFTQDKSKYIASLDNNPDIKIINKESESKSDIGTGMGTGLGLALCKSLIELHGGNIWLDSNYKEGACFCFSLPLKKYAKVKP